MALAFGAALTAIAASVFTATTAAAPTKTSRPFAA